MKRTLLVLLALALLPAAARADRENIYSTRAQMEFAKALTAQGKFGVPRYATASLPTCSADADQAAIAYDTTTDEFKICNGSAWAVISTSGSSVWSAISNPTGNLALTMAAYTTTFTWNATTGAGVNMFSLTDTASNTGTGYVLSVATASSSAAKPVRITAGGTSNGVEMSTAGSLGIIGTGGIVATTGDSATSFFSAGTLENARTTADSANTASAIVARDGSGNFAAGTITAALTGNASTATALAANGANCSAGNYPLGVDASGAVESCTAAGANTALSNLSSIAISDGDTTANMATGAGVALALAATAPAAAAGASQVGIASSLTASNAVASTDTAGAAAGGAVTITSGNAARLTSGNANGGDINLTLGTGIGTGTTGQIVVTTGSSGIAPRITASGTLGQSGLNLNSNTSVDFVFQQVIMGSVRNPDGFQVGSSRGYHWTAGAADATLDTGLRRAAAGEVVVTAASSTAVGDFYYSTNVETVTTTKTTTAIESQEMYVNTGDADGSTITLLNDPTIGVAYRFNRDAAQVVTVVTSAGETLNMAGVSCATSITLDSNDAILTVWARVGGAGGEWVASCDAGTCTCNP